MAAIDNRQWAEGFFRQACYDIVHAKELLRMSASRPSGALSLAQFQQAAEKSMKAAVLLNWNGRPDGELISTHHIWQDVVSNKSLKLGNLESRYLAAVGEDRLQSSKLIKTLEDFAPHRSIDDPNTEYPWNNGHSVETPATFFARACEHDIILTLQGVADAIFLSTKDLNKNYGHIFDAIELVFKRNRH